MRASLNMLLNNPGLRQMPCAAHPGAEPYDCAEWLLMLDKDIENWVPVLNWHHNEVIVMVSYQNDELPGVEKLTERDFDGNVIARVRFLGEAMDEMRFITTDESNMISEIMSIDDAMLSNAR